MGTPQQIITVNYRAIKWDNHQGGSGMPFQDKFVFNVDFDLSLHDLSKLVISKIEIMEVNIYVGEVDVISIELN